MWTFFHTHHTSFHLMKYSLIMLLLHTGKSRHVEVKYLLNSNKPGSGQVRREGNSCQEVLARDAQLVRLFLFSEGLA